MKENHTVTYCDSISEEEFNTFLKLSGEEQWKILLAHAEVNNKRIILRRKETMEKNQEIRNQFNEFLHTKGICAKFKVAFANMAESTRKQKEADRLAFEEVKRKSTENNPEFTEFLHTKGIKAKVKLVIENIKKGAKEASKKGAKPQEESRKLSDYSAKNLTDEFNSFLKAKGLDGKYVVEVLEESKLN